MSEKKPDFHFSGSFEPLKHASAPNAGVLNSEFCFLFSTSTLTEALAVKHVRILQLLNFFPQ